MAAPLLSASWYRVAGVRPQLRSHARLHRHRYRGEVWYLLQDPVSGHTHRFSPSAHLVIAAMDGRRTVAEIWEIANRRMKDAAPTQDEMIQVLGQLHSADMLQSDVSPDVAEVFERGERTERAKARRSWQNPMAVRIPLIDPDRFLDRLMPYVRPLWGFWGALVWLAVVLPALVLVPAHWADLTGNLGDRILAADNLVLLALLFPVIKALHELGHGVAAKAGGGEVHDMGLMLLVLMPVPYVDASSASVFRSRWQRALVGAAGMGVEVFIAALAFYLWLLAEPGLARAITFDVMVIASVSALVFNGNPLLRFDAYYILADLTEIPNLASRSLRYLGYLVERYAFGAREAQAPHATGGEKIWFVCYAIAAFIYRLVVVVAIVLFIAGEFFVIGVLLAIWATVTMIVLPVAKAAGRVLFGAALMHQRRRVVAVSTAALVALSVLVFLVPVPFRTQAEGITWLPEQAIVRAGTDGFVREFLVEPGTRVTQGTALIDTVDPTLQAQIRLSEGKVAELEAVYTDQFVADRVKAEIVREQLEGERAKRDRLRERAAELVVRSPQEGTLVVAHPQDLPGRLVRKGELLGYVIEAQRPLVRVVIRQGQVDVVRLATRRVEVRSAERIGEVIVGTMMRHVPGGADQLPSRALATEGGGSISVDPRDASGTKALERLFQLDIALEQERPPHLLYGGRVFVRFEHAPEPLASQWYRRIRQLFLSRFNV